MADPPPDGITWRGVMAAAFYGTSSATMAFLNKGVLSYYSFNFPFFILTLQMVLTVVALQLLCWWGLLSLTTYTLKNGRAFLWPSVFCGLHSVLSLYALHGLNIPMYGAVKRCTPLVNLVLSVVLLKKGAPSLLLTASIIVITGGCFVAAMGDLTYDPSAYTLGLLSVMAQGLYLTLIQQHAEQNNTSSLQILQLNSYNTLGPFLVMCLVVGEPSRIARMDCLSDPGFILLFTVLLCIGCLFNYALFLCTAVNSALTTSLVGVGKSTVQTVAGFFAFGGVKFHPLNVTGIGINTIGGFLYAYAKYSEKSSKRPKVLQDQNLNIVMSDGQRPLVNGIDKSTILTQDASRTTGFKRELDTTLFDIRIS